VASWSVGSRIANEINNRINENGACKGTIENRENIGKTSNELVALWNATNPNDQGA
jgi:hypothetical protein